jgi:hypothetical protein
MFTGERLKRAAQPKMFCRPTREAVVEALDQRVAGLGRLGRLGRRFKSRILCTLSPQQQVSSPGRSLPAISLYEPRRLPKVEACRFDFEVLTLLPSLRKILSAHPPKKTGLTGRLYRRGKQSISAPWALATLADTDTFGLQASSPLPLSTPTPPHPESQDRRADSAPSPRCRERD